MFFFQNFSFCEVGTHAKFRNPTTTPSVILVTGARKEERKIPKIVAYLSLLRWSHALGSDQFVPCISCSLRTEAIISVKC